MAIRNRIKVSEYREFEQYLKGLGFIPIGPQPQNLNVVGFRLNGVQNKDGKLITIQFLDGCESLDVSNVDESIVHTFCLHGPQRFPYLLQPLSMDELIEQQDVYGNVTDFVAVNLKDIIDGDFESFLNLLSEKMTGTCLLSDISYQTMGCEEGMVIFEVKGNINMILEDANDSMYGSCFPYAYDEYAENGNPLIFMRIPLSTEDKVRLWTEFDLWYANTAQETVDYAFELYLIARYILHDGALPLNPRHLMIVEILKDICAMLPESYQKVYYNAVMRAVSGDIAPE